MRYILAVLFVFSLYASAFAQDNTAEPVTQAPVPTVSAPEPTSMGVVVQNGGTLVLSPTGTPANDTTPSDPFTNFMIFLSGLIVGGLTFGIGGYVAGGRLAKAAHDNKTMMTLLEGLYNLTLSKTPAPLKEQARTASGQYKEFLDELTDDVPAMTKIVPTAAPTPPIPTLPRDPGEQ